MFPRRTGRYRYYLLSKNTDRIISLSITLTAVHLMRGWEEQILPDTNFNFNSDLSSTQNSCVKTFPIISPAIFYHRRIPSAVVPFSGFTRRKRLFSHDTSWFTTPPLNFYIEYFSSKLFCTFYPLVIPGGVVWVRMSWRSLFRPGWSSEERYPAVPSQTTTSKPYWFLSTTTHHIIVSFSLFPIYYNSFCMYRGKLR